MTDTGVLHIIINDDKFTVYQAVSPNGDQKNDYWHIEGIDYYPDNHVWLYDRFQNLVYETKGYDNLSNIWVGQANRGLSKGKLPEGTCYYYITLGSEDQSKSGFIVLKTE